MGGDAWGIAAGYHDALGRWHETPASTTAAVRAALGAPEDGSGVPPSGAVAVVRAGEPFHVAGTVELHTEDAGCAVLPAGASLPADLAPGYHRLVDPDGGGETALVLAPARCPLPDGLRTWGWAVQLYALRSARSWGHGDFGDLGDLARWSRDRGAGMMLVNPLHAPAPVLSQQPSPYFPTSRVYRNPLYLRVEDVPGWSDLSGELAPVAARGRALDADRRIDRDAVFRCKYEALGRLWERFRARPTDDREHAEFEAYRAEQGLMLDDFATFAALVEHRPASWHDWPEGWRRPRSPAVRHFARDQAERVRFHAWVQWLVDRQIAAAGQGLDLMTDLAIGVDRGGADAWMWQDTFALTVSVGAPPDDFNRRGQDWGLPPFNPWKLRAAAYEPFVRTVRAAFRHAGGLRIDHVMGLFRLFCIPEGGSPADGCYVYFPHRDLLGVVALEAQRAGAYVVGEDLGTVEDDVRHELAEQRVLSYRLLQFEDQPATALPPTALAAVTTHDLPTIAGYLTGADATAQRAMGLDVNEDGMAHIARMLRRRAGLEPHDGQQDDPPVDAVVRGVYEELATAPCAILNATLDDVLAVQERPNVPGTIDEWPNWRLALPVPLEAILTDPRVDDVARLLEARAPLPPGRSSLG